MNEIIWLSDYQNAVLSSLHDIPWAATIGLYPDLPEESVPTPAILFDVARWERAGHEIGGNLTLSLTCNIYILSNVTTLYGENDSGAASAETLVRNAALKMSDWVEGRQFGKGTAPAMFKSAEPALQQCAQDASPYAAWSVSFTQLVAVGQDEFEDDILPTLKEFWLGVFPDVGEAHRGDYTLLAKSEDD